MTNMKQTVFCLGVLAVPKVLPYSQIEEVQTQLRLSSADGATGQGIEKQ